MTFDPSEALEQCRPLLAIADKYAVPELLERCGHELMQLQITAQNLPEVYALAVKYSFKVTIVQCQKYAGDLERLKSVER